MKKTGQELEYTYPKQKFDRMGAVPGKDGVIFTASIPEGTPAFLILYRRNSEEIVAEIPFPKERIVGNAAAVMVKNCCAAKHEYNFRISGEIVQDPYARVLRGEGDFGTLPKGDHTVRCGIVQEIYDWEGDTAPEIPYEDVIMYNLHVRGFTRQKNSGVRHKGTFRGIMEKTEYLKQLGINQIKLMPAYDFWEMETVKTHADYRSPSDMPKRMNYWGYTKACHFAPKRVYAASANPVREFKDFVKMMHRSGIEVLMEFYFGETVNPRYVVDCLLYWKEEYHVDGFHILGNQALSNLIAADPLFSDTKLLNTYFPVDEIYGTRMAPENRMVAECNSGFLNDVRRFLKGEEECLRMFAERMSRNPEGSGLINYLTDHDGFTMYDLVSYEERHNEENGEQNRDGIMQNYSWNCGEEGATRKKKIQELRRRQMRNAYCMLLFSAATPMLLAGDEIENSQGGNNNPYCLDNEVSWIDWKGWKSGRSRMYAFVRDLIAFRKTHPILHRKKALTRTDSLSCGFPDLSYHGNRAWYGDFDSPNRQIGMMYCGQYAGSDEFLYIAYNMYGMERQFAIPHIPKEYQWYVAVDTGIGVYQEEEMPLLENARLAVVSPHTVMVFVGRRQHVE